jgi:hypothetical protein
MGQFTIPIDAVNGDQPMSDHESPSMRWSTEQRLAFIDRRLYWDAKINRSDLRGFFSISIPQASADLSRYDLDARGNMAYDKHAKTYVATPDFHPRSTPSAREYLAQLQLIADGVLREGESWLGWVPPFGVAPKVRRRLEAAVLRNILEAIRTNLGLQIRYQSMSSSEPSERWIVPHALSFDGYRWHVRAWCQRREKFLDFVLARMLAVLDTRPDKTSPETDRAWQEMTTLRLGPNPRLPIAQQKAIALDYGMSDGAVEVEVRRSLVYYMARQLLLDVAPHLPPERAQIVLLNSDDVNADLREVGEATIGA